MAKETKRGAGAPSGETDAARIGREQREAAARGPRLILPGLNRGFFVGSVGGPDSSRVGLVDLAAVTDIQVAPATGIATLMTKSWYLVTEGTPDGIELYDFDNKPLEVRQALIDAWVAARLELRPGGGDQVNVDGGDFGAFPAEERQNDPD